MVMQLPIKANQEEIDAYVEFWRSRGEKAVEIMGWSHCFAFDPDFAFVKDDGSSLHLPLDVVEKLIELHGRLVK